MYQLVSPLSIPSKNLTPSILIIVKVYFRLLHDKAIECEKQLRLQRNLFRGFEQLLELADENASGLLHSLTGLVAVA